MKARKRGEETSKILLELSNNNSNLFTSTGMCLTDITSITLFKKFITDIMNTTGLKEALKKKNLRITTIVDDESKLANYIGALLLRDYILSILRQIKKKKKKKKDSLIFEKNFL